MNFKEIAQEFAKIGLPLIGAALPIPGGAAIGSALAAVIGGDGTPSDILERVKAAGEAMQQAQQFELTHQETLLKIQVDAEVAASAQVNETMQAEDKSEHWPTYSWRPLLGFAVAFNAVSSSVLVLSVFFGVIFGSASAAVAVAQLPTVLGSLAAINATILPVLGIASWFRGKGQLSGDVGQKG